MTCWENDYRHILQYDYLRKLFFNIPDNFTHRRLLVNQVISRNHVYRLAAKCTEFLDEIVFVQDFYNEAFDLYLNGNPFTKMEEQYSRSQFTGLLLCDTPYLFHLNADIEVENPDSSNFLEVGIELLSRRKDSSISFSPNWAFRELNGILYGDQGYLLEQVNRFTFQDLPFFECSGFTDNCYLIDKRELTKIDWNCESEFTRNYPKYAGQSFERRIANYMFTNNLSRIVDPAIRFINTEIPKSNVVKFLNALINLFGLSTVFFAYEFLELILLNCDGISHTIFYINNIRFNYSFL